MPSSRRVVKYYNVMPTSRRVVKYYKIISKFAVFNVNFDP